MNEFELGGINPLQFWQLFVGNEAKFPHSEFRRQQARLTSQLSSRMIVLAVDCIQSSPPYCLSAVVTYEYHARSM